MTVSHGIDPPVLLRSRSLMTGSFNENIEDEPPFNANFNSTSSSSSTTTTTTTTVSWDTSDPVLAPSNPSFDKTFLPPIVDDCNKIDHSRRVAIAHSHGIYYDEKRGTQAILEALCPHERQFLADKYMPLRHYRAEKGNLEEAIRKIKLTLRWREEFRVNDIKQCFDHLLEKTPKNDLPSQKEKELNALASTIAHENETGKIYCRGYDKEGRAILYLIPGRENSNNEIDNMRHLVYNLERAIACSRRHSGRQKICIVIGYQGFKLSNAPPMSTVKHTLAILQGHYPERMHKAYICDPPLMFRTFWGIIKHFIDPATLEKVAFCHGKEGQKILERDFDTTTTEQCAGGTKTLRKFDTKEFLYNTPFSRTFDERNEGTT